MTRRYEEFDPFEWARLPYLIREAIDNLAPEDQVRAVNAEPGSTRVRKVDGGWVEVTVGNADVVVVGQFHMVALGKQTMPGTQN